MHKIILIVLSLFATSSFATELVNITQSQLGIATQADQAMQGIRLDISRVVSSHIIDDHQGLYAGDLSLIFSHVEAIMQHTFNSQTLTMPDDLQKESDDVNTVMRYSLLS